MNDENQRLKGMLSQATNSYGALQMYFMTIVQQQQQQTSKTYEVIVDLIDGLLSEYNVNHLIDFSMIRLEKIAFVDSC